MNLDLMARYDLIEINEDLNDDDIIIDLFNIMNVPGPLEEEGF
eukprot:CAMPEP_0201283278 /NCGR_PEP_ID=MMETSP1317-20130820/8132_1 /ASSEMBLY_ACC=CAM_ASM_000770 /TAXON_ID=187299 /ORGANISM="Undescribed Undescribed, Strain Undescribed" /LENGTH=42 /DNA_ID= /DNA_START= /DNA_END= /DNA_ORIENTATION=